MFLELLIYNPSANWSVHHLIFFSLGFASITKTLACVKDSWQMVYYEKDVSVFTNKDEYLQQDDK